MYNGTNTSFVKVESAVVEYEIIELTIYIIFNLFITVSIWKCINSFLIPYNVDKFIK